MWLVMSICLYVGARAGVGIWLGSFSAAALLSAAGAVRGLGPLEQVQLFLGGTLVIAWARQKVQQLRG